MGKMKAQEVIHHTREAWLMAAIDLMKPMFKEQGHEIPPLVKAACGFPTAGKKAIGECHSPDSSKTKERHIFVCPTQEDGVAVLGILTHELCHAVLEFGIGHKKPFIQLARAVGLQGKPTHATAVEGTPLHDKLILFREQLGRYPHSAMVRPPKNKGKGGNGWIRLRSANEDKYKVVIAEKQLEEHGFPVDPWGDTMVRNDDESDGE